MLIIIYQSPLLIHGKILRSLILLLCQESYNLDAFCVERESTHYQLLFSFICSHQESIFLCIWHKRYTYYQPPFSSICRKWSLSPLPSSQPSSVSRTTQVCWHPSTPCPQLRSSRGTSKCLVGRQTLQQILNLPTSTQRLVSSHYIPLLKPAPIPTVRLSIE